MILNRRCSTDLSIRVFDRGIIIAAEVALKLEEFSRLILASVESIMFDCSFK